ncbi:FAD-binding domain-containing protein [Lentinula detonsa]|uniref:FAD-binding domain-containing protein n=1 Tax=Lentinula detonsa TaxID=2804962 RepID=A0A9W8NQ48_9AGAR|nr:FAD-binding domain-containing protein [Lentinula detonsa]
METLAIQGEIEILTVESGGAYAAALRRNSDLSVLPAKYVVYPAVYEDISSILSYALTQSPPLEIAVKGGGAHSSTWASSNGGVVIDLGKLKKVTIFEDKQYITVQGGALWGDVYEVTAREHVDVVGSPLWFVGVGGFTLGGGYGPLSGQYGLAIDNMISATVVLANGRIVKTSREEEPDLFWAIRGRICCFFFSCLRDDVIGSCRRRRAVWHCGGHHVQATLCSWADWVWYNLISWIRT